jgi:hypothetical protein
MLPLCSCDISFGADERSCLEGWGSRTSHCVLYCECLSAFKTLHVQGQKPYTEQAHPKHLDSSCGHAAYARRANLRLSTCCGVRGGVSFSTKCEVGERKKQEELRDICTSWLLTTTGPSEAEAMVRDMWICEDGLVMLTATVRAVSDEEAVRHYARFMRVADARANARSHVSFRSLTVRSEPSESQHSLQPYMSSSARRAFKVRYHLGT